MSLFLGHIEPFMAQDFMNDGVFDREVCAKVACLNRDHEKIVKGTRQYPIISDIEIQRVFRKYRKAIEKKEHSDQSSSLEKLQYLVKLKMGVLQQKIDDCRAQFFEVRNDLAVMELFGSRENYRKLPILFENIGVTLFEEPFKCFKKRSLPLELLAECAEFVMGISSPLITDKVLFLGAICLEIAHQNPLFNTKVMELVKSIHPTALEMIKKAERLLSFVFEKNSDFLSKMQEKFQIFIDNDDVEIDLLIRAGALFFAICKETVSFPVTRIPISLIKKLGIADAFIVRAKNMDTSEALLQIYLRKNNQGWFSLAIPIDVNDSLRAIISKKEDDFFEEPYPLFTEEREKTEAFYKLSRLLTGKTTTDENGGSFVSDELHKEPENEILIP